MTVALIVIDQVTKLWIVHHFALYERVYVLPVLDITLAYNKGAAFSFLEIASGWQRWLFTGLAVAVGIGILGWMRRLNGRMQWLLCCALSLILAGALGNVIDRMRIGHVVDFILVHWDNSTVSRHSTSRIRPSLSGPCFCCLMPGGRADGAKRASV